MCETGRLKATKFYDNLISSGTKILCIHNHRLYLFYDNLISSGTKISFSMILLSVLFYDNLISSGTKIIIP